MQVVVSALLLAVGFGFYRYLKESDFLSIRWIAVDGVQTLSPSTVATASGITTADNLLFFDAQAARESVEALPSVHTCSLERIFPDRVDLRVIERAPAVTILVDNHLFEVDAKGQVLTALPQSAEHTGPLITNLPGLDTIAPGGCVYSPAFDTALRVWWAFGDTHMAKAVTVSELAAFSPNHVVMYCNELPCEIRWGRGRYAERARRLDILWQSHHGHLPCAQYVDLRFDRDVVCR